MSYEQIRRSFDRTSSLIDQARRLIDQRLQLIQERKTARPMEVVPLSAVEFVPLASLAGRAAVDVGALHSRGYSDYALEVWRDSGRTRSLNLDGILVYPTDKENSNAWSNVFRDGRFETVMISGHVKDDGKHIIWSKVVTDFFQQGVEAGLRLAKKHDISGPAVVRLALTHVEGYSFAIKDEFWQMGASVADRNNLILPEIWIEDVSVDIDVAVLLSDSMDVLWQCFAHPRAQDQS